ncbi:MAG TPA: AI-2E family transporter [Planctomycetota bacterium]|nr:AI-2E family transporter [Planctomycetota bacterium]
MFSRIPPARRGVLLLVIVLAFGWFAWTVRAALNPLLVALMFAYMLHPMVLSLEARGWKRRHAVNAIYVSATLLFLGITLGSYLQARTLWADLMNDGALVEQLDERVQQAAGQVEGWIDRLTGQEPSAPIETQPEADAEAAGAEETSPLQSLIADVRAWIEDEDGGVATLHPGNLWALVRRAFGSLVSAAVFAFLVPVYTWFLLFELERIQNFVRSYLPVGDREVASRIGAQIAEVLGNFFRGRLLVCLVKGLMLAGFMAALGIPYAFLLGMLSGLFSLIPFAGPTIGYGAAFLLALLEFEPLGALWRVGLVFAIGELVEGYVLLPRILGDKLGLHPLAVFVSLTVFGAALGAFGVLLALPLTAAATILTRELVLPLAKDWAEGRRPDASGP